MCGTLRPHTSFLPTNRRRPFLFLPLRGNRATMGTVSRNVRLPVGREAPAFHHSSANAFPYFTRALHFSNTLNISTTQTPPAGNWPFRDPHKKEVLAMSSTLGVGQAAQVLGRSKRSMHHLAWPGQQLRPGKLGRQGPGRHGGPPHRPRQKKKIEEKNEKDRNQLHQDEKRTCKFNTYSHTISVDITPIQTNDGNSR